MPQPLSCQAGWKKLLVCTDGSSEGQHAVSQALELARSTAAQICAVRVVQIVPEFEAVAPDLRACLEEEIRSQMAAAKAEADGCGVNLDTRVRQSQLPHAAIVEEAQGLKADIIIMGRYGHTGLGRLFMGNVTYRVIGFSPIDVLVVPQEATLRFRRLLVASDGSPFSDAALEAALCLAREKEAKLFGVSVAREEGDILEAKEILERMLRAANEAGLPLQGISPQGQQPDDAIIQEALNNGVDLIIMGSHGRTGVKRLLLGSVTERVIGQATCPVLVVKKK